MNTFTTLSYNVTPPRTATGNAVFTGKIGGVEIIGDTTLIQRIPEPVGIFDDHWERGYPKRAGNVTYNSQTGEYKITSSSLFPPPATLDTHMVYSEISGDFTIKATVSVENLEGGSFQSWAGIGVIDSLFTWPKGYFIVTSTSEDVWWTTIPTYDAPWEFQSLAPGDPNDSHKLELVREGNTFSTFYGEERILLHQQILKFTDPVYVEMHILPGNSDGLAVGYFTNVVIETIEPETPVQDWELYK